jgi:hypothetical protein
MDFVSLDFGAKNDPAFFEVSSRTTPRRYTILEETYYPGKTDH